MNERIRELAEQCRWQEVVVEDGEEWIHAHFDEAKFAELIVRECANACLAATDPGSSVHLVSVAYADAVKRHFGVNE